MSCTLYRSSNGNYQEKMARLAFRERNNRGLRSNRTVAKTRFNLAQYVSNGLGGNSQVTIPVMVSAGSSKVDDSGELDVTISSRFMAPGDDGFSEMTAMGTSEMSDLPWLDDCEPGEMELPTAVDGAPHRTDTMANKLQADITSLATQLSPSGAPGEVEALGCFYQDFSRLVDSLEKRSGDESCNEAILNMMCTLARAAEKDFAGARRSCNKLKHI